MYSLARSSRFTHLRKIPKNTPSFRSLASTKPKTPADFITFGKSHQAEYVDFRFTDLHGTEHHVQLPLSEVDEGLFKNGVPFDGSSLRGWQPINASDMALIPDPSTATIDAFAKFKTVNITCDVIDPVEKKPYSRDPRGISKKAIEYLRSTGIAHDCFVGPEQEFFLFDSVAYELGPLSSYHKLTSRETYLNSGQAHLGYKIRKKEGYFPVRPWDQLQDVRTEICKELANVGFTVERSHHEVAGPGQGEINYRFSTLLGAADNVQMFKYIARNVATKYGLVITFMPKPIPDDNGTGMHTHVSLHDKDGKNFFTGPDSNYSGLSDMALYFIGGLIKHAKAVLAFTNPTVNSYRRLVPGFEAPVNMAYSARNRSAAIRIPISHPKARRIEFRTPDGSCNPYLAFSAILMAGLDGIQNKIHPGPSLDKDIYSLSAKELEGIVKAPADLEEAISSLEQDHKFLTKGNVFTDDLLQMWIDRKRQYEIDVVRKIPTPFDFHQYFDC